MIDCGRGVKGVWERMGSYFAYILYSIHLKCYRTSANVLLGSYSLTYLTLWLVMVLGEGRDRDGTYVSLSEGFCSSVV